MVTRSGCFIRFREDVWVMYIPLSALLPRIYGLLVEQGHPIIHYKTDIGWNFTFHRHLLDRKLLVGRPPRTFLFGVRLDLSHPDRLSLSLDLHGLLNPRSLMPFVAFTGVSRYDLVFCSLKVYCSA